ncbi:MAG: DUF438 domain-containing protein [Candidatus Marinimicrobia bacterium]|nr:DUF438 domain-containing protein [Candidatus Neomarinimicrobiota bacterium]MCK9483319.1 DUF438 domain-containing protein [Candidatus Neomarinimicrobiota bacterium]MCK9560260.1 DUF438 domain-containing protein [Candidatus Neomarinimicrobiota bacterium]
MPMEQSEKQVVLKSIIKRLHQGVAVDKLKKEFGRLIKDTSPEEIADMENALIQEGFPVEEVQRLCDVHAQVFDQALKKVGKASKMPGHPVYTFLAENKEARKILKTLKKCARKAAKSSASQPDFQALIDQFNLLKEIEKHYARKENQLFPLLEAKKFTGPTQVMWGKHDEIRAMLKELGSIIEKKEWKQVTEQVNRVISAIKKLMFLEEKILFPTSARKLNNLEWAKIKNGESAIGYAWVTPSNLWDAEIAKAMSSAEKQPLATSVEEAPQDDAIKLSEGRLTPEQIDLMLKRLPFDITFVDENDQVRYYSDTPDRLFPRSPAIIGREVQKCHPPKSVHIVNDIVAKFKAKEKDVAEFWIQMNGKFIHIRYFPVYDNTGNYKGVIEVSQEISQIKKLEGQRRLLDW